MKRIFMYTIIGIAAASLCGTTTYAIAYSNSTKGANSNSSESSSTNYNPSYYDSNIDGQNLTGIAAVIYKATKKGEMSISDATISIQGNINGHQSDTMSLVLNNGDIDYTSTNAIKLKSDLEVKYENIHTYMNMDYEAGDYAYFSFKDGSSNVHKLMAKAPTDISGVVTLLSGIVSTPSFDLDGIASSLTSVFESLDADTVDKTATATNNGYKYTIPLGNISLPIGTKTISFTNLNFIVESDQSYNISYLGFGDSTVGIEIADSTKAGDNTVINLGLDLNLSINTVSSFTGMTSDEKAKYTDISAIYETTNSLCETIANIANQTIDGSDNPNYRKFNSSLKIDVDYPLTNQKKLGIDGKLNADLSSLSDVSNFDQGVFELCLDKTGTDKSVADVHYEQGTSYLKVGDSIKGKVTNSSLGKVVSLASKMTSDPTEEEMASAKASDVLSLSCLIAQAKNNPLLIGNYIPTSLISDFSYSDSAITFYLSGKSVGLDSDTNMAVSINTTSSGSFKSFSITNISYHNMVMSISLDLSAGCSFSIDPSTGEYDDYSSVSSIFQTVSDFYHIFSHDDSTIDNVFSVGYSMNMTAPNSNKYVASGVIEGDTTGLDLTNLNGSDYGKYHISAGVNDLTRGQTHSIDAYYQDKSIYFASNHGVIKNSISNTCTGKLVDLFKNSSSSTSVSFDSMQSVMDFLNDTFKSDSTFMTDVNNILEGDLSSLSDIITLSNGDDSSSLILSINLSLITEDSVYADFFKDISSLKIELDSDTKELKDIKISGLKYVDADKSTTTGDITLTINSDASTYTPLTSDQTGTYVAVDNAVDAFINLPSYMDQFELTLDGSLGDASISGYANVDRKTDSTKPDAGGNITVNEPLGNNKYQSHSINFSYLGSGTNVTDANGKDRSYLGYVPQQGQSTADYNGNMHLIMKNSSVFDVIDSINNASDSNLLKPSNLLSHYSKTAASIANGLSIQNIIADKDYLTLLDNYIRKISVTNDEIILSVNPALLSGDIDYTQDYDDYTGTPFTMTIKYSSNSEGAYQIDGLTLTGDVSGQTMNISIARKDYNTTTSPTCMEYVGNESKFINLDNLPLFLQMGLNTTEQSYFYLTGSLSLDVDFLFTGASVANLKAFCMAKVKVTDTKTEAYIYVLAYNKNRNSSASTNPSTKGFYCTEYFVDEDMAYVCHTENNSGTITSENFKVTRDELLGSTTNILYYLLDYTLDLYEVSGLGTEIMYQQVGSSSSSSATIYHDYSKYIDSATYSSTASKFTLVMNLGNIVYLSSVLSLNKIEVDITHDSDNKLESLYVGQSGSDPVVSVLGGMVKIDNLSLKANYHSGATEDMTRYSEYISAFNTNASTSALTNYQVTSIKVNTFLGIPTSRTVKTNGQAVKFTYGSADSVFFCPNYQTF